MVARKDIKKYVNALARQFAPERVILFGSYARGNPGDDSDVDMLVIMEHPMRKDVEQAVAIDIQLNRTFPLDLIVRRPSEVSKRLAMGDIFLRTILGEGQVLHDRRS
ncbi:MAG: nucleotidyltransferase domain-containing protein [bacterium]|jgi:predicted nucleotidyltransferase